MATDSTVRLYSRELESHVYFGPMQPVSYVEYVTLRAGGADTPARVRAELHPLVAAACVLHHGGIFENVRCQDKRPVRWEHHDQGTADAIRELDAVCAHRALSPFYDQLWLARTVTGDVCLIVVPYVGGSHYHVIDVWDSETWQETVDTLAARLQQEEFIGAYDLDAFCARVAALRSLGTRALLAVLIAGTPGVKQGGSVTES